MLDYPSDQERSQSSGRSLHPPEGHGVAAGFGWYQCVPPQLLHWSTYQRRGTQPVALEYLPTERYATKGSGEANLATILKDALLSRMMRSKEVVKRGFSLEGRTAFKDDACKGSGETWLLP